VKRLWGERGRPPQIFAPQLLGEEVVEGFDGGEFDVKDDEFTAVKSFDYFFAK